MGNTIRAAPRPRALWLRRFYRRFLVSGELRCPDPHHPSRQLSRAMARLRLKQISLRLVPGQTLRFQSNTTFRGPLSLLVEWDT
jgi:hypothetical protein